MIKASPAQLGSGASSKLAPYKLRNEKERSVIACAREIAKNLIMSHEVVSKITNHLYCLVFSQHRRTPVHVVKGVLRNTNQTTSLVYEGSEHSLHQLSSMLFSPSVEVTYVGEFSFRHLDSAISQIPSDIIAIRVKKPLISRYLKTDFLLLPTVNFVLDLRKPIEEIIRQMSRRRRRDLRKIEESGYTYEVYRRSSEVLDFFYYKMYLPYVKKRFEKAASIKSYLESEIIYRHNGGVLIVRKEKDYHGGILFQIRGKTILAWSLGIYEGNRELVRSTEAALFFLVRWAKAHDIETLDYGTSLPFLKEGIFTYKKEWGMSVKELDQTVLALKIASLTEGSLLLLQQNPFIISDRGAIKGVVLLEGNLNAVELKDVFSKYYLPTLSSILVLSYSRSMPSKPTNQTSSRAVRVATIHELSKPLQNLCSLMEQSGYKVVATDLVASK